MLQDGWETAVLDFWFRQLQPKQWYVKDEALDREIIEKFGGLYEELAAADAGEVSGTPSTALAAIIVLDQFARNMFRGSPKSFAQDANARAIADAVIGNGFDKGMSEAERQFAYMPFMHSEDLADQDRSVALFDALGKEEGADYARRHRKPIALFGRFPHRNKCLGRDTTDAEQAWIDEHGGF